MEPRMNTASSKTLPANDHYIVAIGASAGGLEAIHEFFDNMPANGNFSFVIIQHLSPDYKSLLVELVAKHTNMKVLEAQQDMPVEKGCVYVIPNNKLLTISDGKLQLSAKNFEKAPNTAIDTFFRSLAEDQGSKAIAIILSGTGTDGTKGIAAIQNAGGIVIVQDPVSAKFDGMPNSAIASGYADYILSPELMPEEIFNYVKERPVRISDDGKPDESLLPEVLKLVEKNCQYDFYNYKTPTILRRIGRRMAHLGYKRFQDYLEHLKNASEECRALGKEFLIGVTKFFRDRAAFDVIHNEVLPVLVRNKHNGDILKIWVAACSTGEEAYSMAILVNELLQSMGRGLEVKIFATDIDLEAIEFASKGIYPANHVAELDDRLVKKYFTRQAGHVVVNADLRKQIVFARHNIIKDPPFIKNDLISCRNMLIYMNVILQRKVLSTLQFSLNTGGYLFLGPSEIPSSIREGFEEINGKWKVYRKISNESRYNQERFPSAQIFKAAREIRYPAKENQAVQELQDEMKNILVEEFGYAAIYVDKNLEVKEAVGDFKKYLSLPDRISAMNLLKMAGSDLSIALNTTIRKANKEGSKVSLEHVRIRQNGKEKLLNIFIKPSQKDGYTLVVLGEAQDTGVQKSTDELAATQLPEQASYISELEEELKDTRASLQMAIESLETANEELQSSNEELLSANEELQSSNEELQSLNEELHTLNTEHQLRIKELIELNDDLNNYFRSSELAQVFLDQELRIRKFNPTAVKMINLIESDIGRPIDHISTNIRNLELLEDIRTTLRTGSPVEKEVQLSNNAICLMRILPYLKQDKQTDGVVISFIDITRLKELDNIIKGVFNSSLSAIMAFRSERNNMGRITDFRWITANHQSDRFLGKSQADYIGKSLRSECSMLIGPGLFDQLVQVVETGKPLRTEIFSNHRGSPEWFELIATQMMDGLVISFTNITEKKKAEEKFRQNYDELMRVKENYRNLNIALEEKVKERTFELSQSEERFRLVATVTNDAIWERDLNSGLVWWSDSFYSRFGYPRTSETGTIRFWLEQVHPEDRKAIDEKIRTALAAGTHWSGRYRFRKADGSYASILDRGTILKDAEGRVYRMVGAMMDITESELAEHRLKEKNEALQKLIQEFRFVTDFIPQMVWATQPDGYHDFFNKRWYDYTGSGFEESKGTGWNPLLHPDDRERAWKAWQHALQSGEPYEIEYRFKSQNGEYRWFLGRALPLKDENGKIIKWFGTCTDIHDQKMANDILEQKVRERTAELEQANLDLEASNNELLQFASVASHDLKEPLRKIHMFSNLIREKYMAQLDGAADYLERIIAASARMTKLINDLLTFTRLSITSSFELADLNLVVEEVMSDLELSISEKQAVIEAGPLPKMEMVTGQMRQVFQNLISNSLKFSRAGEKPRISIGAELVDHCAIDAPAAADGPYCRITIQDNGIGFDNQYAEKIFTIFQRLHSREKYEGTGIGLAITKKIIERHHGVIAASSRLNEGARFVMVLPLKQNHTVQQGLSVK